MSFLKPASLGIIACPGAETFAAEIISHLKQVYSRRFDKLSAQLAKRYNVSREEIIRRINFQRDLVVGSVLNLKSITSYKPTRFKVPVRFTCFANGEVKAEINKSVRRMDIYIIIDPENHDEVMLGGKAMRFSVNDHLMNLFVTVEAALQAGARTVTLVIPSFPYSRQHKRRGREALTASWFARICEYMNVSRIITLDIHSREIENSLSNSAIENLHGSYQIMKKLLTVIDPKDEDLVVVSPDTGAVDRNKYYSANLHKPLALLYKERDYSRISNHANDTNISTTRLLGDVEGKTVFMADDMVGTGGTLIQAMRYLKKMGAKKIICAVSLPLFSGNAVEHFQKAYEEGLFYRIIGTNAVHHTKELLACEWFVSANISGLFARIIFRLHHGKSLSPLLDNSGMIQRLLKQKDE
ncbi:MAG: ribose-phosphate diphosphokinase [Spirochaetales bacterium]|nr:ribose-phosphate diphosphokinase [Spirochaetales bacterium]